MRMLLLLLLLLNAAIAVYYLAGDAAQPPGRPAPGTGTLTLVSEMDPAAGSQGAPKSTAGAPDCWRSDPVARGEPLQQLLAAVREAGFSRLRLTPVSNGYAVLLSRPGTIQEAAADVERLRAAGVEEPRVRPSGNGGLAVVSGRFDNPGAARAHAAELRELGVEARVLSPESGGSTVRVFVRGGPDGLPRAGRWTPINCQAARG